MDDGPTGRDRSAGRSVRTGGTRQGSEGANGEFGGRVVPDRLLAATSARADKAHITTLEHES